MDIEEAWAVIRQKIIVEDEQVFITSDDQFDRNVIEAVKVLEAHLREYIEIAG